MLSRIKSWYYKQDTQQRINVFTSFVSDSFRVVMATLLSVFVPQNCQGHICSFEENTSNLIEYNIFVLAFNFLTLFVFILLYIVELYREKWMISHFDYDKNFDELYLKTFKNQYSEIFEKLNRLNRYYILAYKNVRYFYILNFIFSAILVYHYYYLDYKSITVLLTNVALCWNKIKQGLKIASDSHTHELAYSFFNTVNLSFNTMDKKSVKNPTRETLV
jgi:hypothetical protein